jgi:hypothetical protein
MKSRSSLIIVTLSLVLGGFVSAHPVQPVPTGEFAPVHGWIAEESDNICGITALKRVTNPAKVDYDHLYQATPQIKEMKRRDIDPESAEGKALRKGAATLITKSSEIVRKAKGHCSVWKVISHNDGRKISDVTQDVLERF